MAPRPDLVFHSHRRGVRGPRRPLARRLTARAWGALLLGFALLLLPLAGGCADYGVKEPKDEAPRPLPRHLADPAAVAGEQAARATRARERAASWPDFVEKPNVLPPEPYRIGNGDVVTVDIYARGQQMTLEDRLEDLSGDYTVLGDGTITLKYLGNVSVRALTLEKAAAAVAKALPDLYRSPRVNVSLKSPRQRYVVVNGFPTPGKVVMGENATLLEALTLAGWDMQKSSIRGVLLIRGGRQVIQINLRDITDQYDLRYNMPLVEGDLIIPAPDSLPVRVTGEVKKPGMVPVAPNGSLTVSRALSAADGVTAGANLQSVRILRTDGSEELIDIQNTLFGDAALVSPVLFAGDELYVPVVSGRGFYIFGQVGKQGFFPMEEQMDVLRATALATIDTFDSDLAKVVLVRNHAPGPPEVYNVRADLLLEGDMTQNMTVRPGDVIYIPRTGLATSLDFLNRLLGPLSGSASFGLQIQSAVRESRK
ncbi:MAG: polysaccharide biosynthesis/export family protein [Planctomycetes bacterium]|nr:polysaccharide biosynthesis/export family protein [Planctomycetota bacterium]